MTLRKKPSNPVAMSHEIERRDHRACFADSSWLYLQTSYVVNIEHAGGVGAARRCPASGVFGADAVAGPLAADAQLRQQLPLWRDARGTLAG